MNKLSPASVKRTWHYEKGRGMCYRMEVDLGPSSEKVFAEFAVDERCMDERMMPPEAIEYELKRKILAFISSSLFAK